MAPNIKCICVMNGTPCRSVADTENISDSIGTCGTVRCIKYVKANYDSDMVSK